MQRGRQLVFAGVLGLLVAGFSLCVAGSAYAQGVNDVHLWPLQAKKAFGPVVTGFLQTTYAMDATDNVVPDNTFRIKNAALVLVGKVTPTVGYFVRFECGRPNCLLGNAEIILDIDPMLQVGVGQSKHLFTHESRLLNFFLPFVDRAEAFEALAPLGRVGLAGRDLGIEVRGAGKQPISWGYGFQVVNGNGINRTDDNNSKDVVGRLWIEPVAGLELGASGWSGKEGVSPKLDVGGWNLYAIYNFLEKRGPIRGGVEYMKQKFDNATGPATKPEGWYAWVGYKVMPKLELLARYARFDQDSNAADKQLDSVTLGATYTFSGYTNLKVNYLFRDADKNYTTGLVNATGAAIPGSDLGNLFIVQLQLKY
jgi:hypothetical protein